MFNNLLIEDIYENIPVPPSQLLGPDEYKLECQRLEPSISEFSQKIINDTKNLRYNDC